MRRCMSAAREDRRFFVRRDRIRCDKITISTVFTSSTACTNFYRARRLRFSWSSRGDAAFFHEKIEQCWCLSFEKPIKGLRAEIVSLVGEENKSVAEKIRVGLVAVESQLRFNNFSGGHNALREQSNRYNMIIVGFPSSNIITQTTLRFK